MPPDDDELLAACCACWAAAAESERADPYADEALDALVDAEAKAVLAALAIPAKGIRGLAAKVNLAARWSDAPLAVQILAAVARDSIHILESLAIGEEADSDEPADEPAPALQ